MTELLKSWGTFIVAVIALVQPWIISLWHKFFRPGTVDIFQTGMIQVGYNKFGPTLLLCGTLRARDRDFFIHSIHIELLKLRDQSRHRFDWGFFGSSKIVFGRPEDITFEQPAGFMLLTSQPYRYNILFIDNSLKEEMQSRLEPVRQAWAKIMAQPGEMISPAKTPDSEAPLRMQASYKEFSGTPQHLEAFGELDHLCYWEKGEYKLTLVVSTSRPDREFRRSWSFALSDGDAKNLRLNSIKILQELCGQYSGQYIFAYVPYKEL